MRSLYISKKLEYEILQRSKKKKKLFRKNICADPLNKKKDILPS